MWVRPRVGPVGGPPALEVYDQAGDQLGFGWSRASIVRGLVGCDRLSLLAGRALHGCGRSAFIGGRRYEEHQGTSDWTRIHAGQWHEQGCRLVGYEARHRLRCREGFGKTGAAGWIRSERD